MPDSTQSKSVAPKHRINVEHRAPTDGVGARPPSKLYEPLDVAKNEVRLLHVHPAGYNAPICCHLSIGSLDDTLGYEALSYVWGSTRERNTITCGGESTGVGTNLFQALRSLRPADGEPDRVLWIDALCINQEDLAEKSTQVALMGVIYSKARRCVAYLGEDWDGCDAAFNAIEQLGSSAKHLFDHPRRDEHGNFHGRRVDSVGLESEELFKDVLKILNAPWITRIWTVQEALLPRGTIFCYGRKSLPRSTLYRMLTFSSRRADDCCSHDGTMKGEKVVRFRTAVSTWQNLQTGNVRYRAQRGWDRIPRDQAGSCLIYLARYRHRDASDPRDKVYAVLSIGDEEWTKLNPPDYSLPIAEVFTRAALADAYVMHRLDFLSWRGATLVPSLPSWVPDWSVQDEESTRTRYTRQIRQKYNACGSYDCCSIRVIHDALGTQLSASGIVIDEISECSTPVDKQACLANPELFRAPFMQIRHLSRVDLNPNEPYGLFSTSTQTAYERILVCGLNLRELAGHRKDTVGLTWASELFENWEASYNHGLSVNFMAGLPVRELNDVFTESVLTRSFVRTKRSGFFGWAPLASRPGDFIVIFKGGRVPFVLRPMLDGRYEFVGDADIESLMEGTLFTFENVADGEEIDEWKEQLDAAFEEIIMV
ncbi:HET-domain-containing protein [Ophiobolus disseminans]|uniref:HET-domain-containing protein n=1 Tax=Ophiobolus disseminans TaxID=1469910 RepID=A0A6A6ZXJ6_9PLEO|nr:HET-domain-containing protein [Ophiobolus disseminans]